MAKWRKDQFGLVYDFNDMFGFTCMFNNELAKRYDFKDETKRRTFAMLHCGYGLANSYHGIIVCEVIAETLKPLAYISHQTITDEFFNSTIVETYAAETRQRMGKQALKDKTEHNLTIATAKRWLANYIRENER